jgi:PAS domain S-box-containing protein
MKWPTEIDVLSSNFDSMTTDLRLATAKIVSSKQRLREIIDSMPSMIFGANKKGELTEWNKEIAHYMKIDREQVMNKTFVALCPNYAFLMPVIEKVLVSKIPERLPNQVVYINEHRSHQDIIIYPIISQEEIAIIVRIDDVTDKINLERAMIQTEKMSSVGTLASGMAHEINGPLSIILQGIQNIERRIDPAIEANQKTAQELGIDLQHVYKYFEYRKLSMFINGMKEAAERASKTVANLVEFSRESNSVKASCSLVEIVEHALILLSTDYDFKNLTEHHQLKIVKNIEENLPNIYASSSDIQQVIFTLLKHALHSMQNQDKNALINIKLSQIDSMIELQIENNGAHLDDETQKRIFEPFFTPKNLSESKKIGLSVSYKIITQGNKGELSLVSKENEGTVFILKLPLATAS